MTGKILWLGDKKEKARVNVLILKFVDMSS